MWTLAGFADEIAPEPLAQCELLESLGIGWVDLRGAWGIGVLDLDDAQLERLQRTLAAAGLHVSAVASPIGKVGIADDLDAHLRRFDRALAVAARLEAPYLRLFSFYLPPGEEPAAHRDEVLRRMDALVRRAAGHDVVLVHENEQGIYGDTPERCLDIVESLGSERLRVVWDPGNFVVCDVAAFPDGYALLRPHLAYVHVKDVRRDPASGATVAVVAGEGDGELEATVRALRDDGFDGFFSLEPHLAISGVGGGFSGAELFATAHAAFVALLEREAIEHR
jgi:sugar phosphate isomerase/epimerase